jgi:predicted O-methyltransferase YrrM
LNFLSLYKRRFLYNIKKKINIDLDRSSKNLSLEKLFIKYRSDKASFWTKKNNGHGYTKFYLKHLKKIKYKKLNILEIGSYAGASAAAFSKFFPNSKITCLDINISNFKYVSKKINVFGLDSTKIKNVKYFFKIMNITYDTEYFDIIIDDGSHKQDDILYTLNFFFRSLKSNGFYIIEDYRMMNFFKHLRVSGEPKVDKLIKYIKKKKRFNSSILELNFQKEMHKRVKTITYFKGLSKISNIVFFKKS